MLPGSRLTQEFEMERDDADVRQAMSVGWPDTEATGAVIAADFAAVAR